VYLVAKGWGNQQIADKLHVAEATVRSHLKRICDKLDLVNRVELALYAVRMGLVSLEETRQGVPPKKIGGLCEISVS
jgi:DNA-binding NarL/FixJ family response regulator